jgi:hypothetical protein
VQASYFLRDDGGVFQRAGDYDGWRLISRVFGGPLIGGRTQTELTAVAIAATPLIRPLHEASVAATIGRIEFEASAWLANRRWKAAVDACR